MIKDNKIPKRLKIGDYFYLSNLHWVCRHSIKKYIATYTNVAGGKISASSTSLKGAIELAIQGRKEMNEYEQELTKLQQGENNE